MSQLFLKSVYEPNGYGVVVAFTGGTWLSLNATSPYGAAGLVIAPDDARRLRDFLSNGLGEQAPEPMGTGQTVYLETDSRGNNTWEQFPTLERAKSFADKRKGVGHKFQAVAYLHRQLVPVVTTSYEWKEIG